MFVAALLLLVVCLFSWKWLKTNRKSIPDFPSPPSHFFLGHAAEIRTTKDILVTVIKYFNSHGPNVVIHLGPIHHGIITKDLRLIEKILTSTVNITKSMNYLYLLPWLGAGLLLSTGSRWRKHRKHLTPAFHFTVLKDFVPSFEKNGSILVAKLQEWEAVECDVEVVRPVALCTLDVMLETALGAKMDVQMNGELPYVRSVASMCRITTERLLSPLKMNPFTFPLTKDYYVHERALRTLRSHTTEVIRSRAGGGAGKKNFMELLLNDAGNRFSLEDVRQEVDTFMFAGHDTTAYGISYVLFCLAKNEEVQLKVFNEQFELFGSDKSPMIKYEDLQNMKYLDCVIKETFRLFPPVPIIGRETEEEIIHDGVTIPAKTNIAIIIYEVHRNPAYFPDPEKFDPDRFSDGGNFPPFAYIPFSAGARNCIGQKFALLEMKSILSKIVRHFHLLPVFPEHNCELAAEAVLQSKNGVRIGLKSRTL